MCKNTPSTNGYCGPCKRQYSKKNYQENKDRYFDNAKKRDFMMDDMINKLKSVPCTDCKVIYPHFVMDFDHVSGKDFGICEMRRRRMSFEKIKEEIKRCEVVCSNCHRIRTNIRNPSRYTRAKNFHN